MGCNRFIKFKVYTDWIFGSVGFINCISFVWDVTGLLYLRFILIEFSVQFALGHS